MILTVGSTKGGVGKSTLAVQFAVSWRRAGRDVLLVDGDRQGSVQKFIAFRAEAGRQPPVVCVQLRRWPRAAGPGAATGRELQ